MQKQNDLASGSAKIKDEYIYTVIGLHLHQRTNLKRKLLRSHGSNGQTIRFFSSRCDSQQGSAVGAAGT